MNKQSTMIITLALLLPIPAGAVEPLQLAPKASKSTGQTLSKPTVTSAPQIKHTWNRHREAAGLLADRPSVSGLDKPIKPEASPTRFIDAPPKFWADYGESWRKAPAPATTES